MTTTPNPETLSEAVERLADAIAALGRALLEPFERTALAVAELFDRLRVDEAQLDAAMRRHPAGGLTVPGHVTDTSRVYFPPLALCWVDDDAARFQQLARAARAGEFSALLTPPADAGTRAPRALLEPRGYAATRHVAGRHIPRHAARGRR